LELDRESWFRLLTSEGVLGVNEVQELRFRRASLEEVLKHAAKTAQPTRGYRLLPIEVSMYATSRQTAYALVDGDFSAPAIAMPPSVRYWRLLRNGARRHSLDRAYRDYLASLPRYVPSLLAPAALPTLVGAAMSRWTQRPTAAEVWPQLEGVSSVAQGCLEIGPTPDAAVWSRFCSVPRHELLSRLIKMVGKDSTMYLD